MNKTMIYLTALVIASKNRIPKTYLGEFMAGGLKVTAPTKEVQIDFLRNYFLSTNLISRGETFKIMTKDGFGKTSVIPDLIAPKFTLGLDDVLAMQPGAPQQMVNGAIIDSIKNVQAKYADMIKATIDNTKERLAAEVFINGSFLDALGEIVSYDLKPVQPFVVATTASMEQELFELIQDYQTRHGIVPEVKVGKNIINRLKEEAKGNNINVSNFAIRYSTNADGVEETLVEVNGKVIKLMVDAKTLQGATLDVSNRVTLYRPERLAEVYAGISYGDPVTNEMKVVAAEVVAGENAVVTEDGQKQIWGQSAFMPVIVDKVSFERYDYSTTAVVVMGAGATPTLMSGNDNSEEINGLNVELEESKATIEELKAKVNEPILVEIANLEVERETLSGNEKGKITTIINELKTKLV